MSRKKKKGSAQKSRGSSLKILLIVQIVIILGLGGTIGYFLLNNGSGAIGAGTGRKDTQEVTYEELETTDILPQEQIAEMSLEEAAAETAKGFLTLYHNCDPKAGDYLRGGEGLSFPEIQAEIAKSMTFEIGETRLVEDEDGFTYALVEVTIETVSFEAAYEDAKKEFSEDADSEEILAKVTEKLKEYAASERDSFVIDIMVLDYVNSREILMDSNLSDAITGGLLTYMEERLEGGEDDE